MTQRWRQTLDDTERRPLFNGVKDNTMNHLGYAGRTSATMPPSLRVGVHMACSPIAPSHPTTSKIRRAVLHMLDHRIITDLMRSLTDVDSLLWTSWDSFGRDNHGAVFGHGDQDQTAPTAWARFLLPDPARRSFWRDPHSADFVLHIEPRQRNGQPAPATGLSGWHRIFTQVLTLPDFIAASLLAGDLELATPDEPNATTAVWLTTSQDLTDLVDLSELQRLPGTSVSQWFHGYAIADNTIGHAPSVVATEWIRQMCDDSLHLDGYERHLLTLNEG